MARIGVLAAAALLAVGPASDAFAAIARTPLLYKNCTNLNKKYLHGLGKRGARDRDSRGQPVASPVTNFTRSTLLYNKAMSYNRGLDRDNDGIACEKA